MRHFKILVFVAVFALGFKGISHAQKLGHVNYERVVANMPETRKLQEDLKKIEKTYRDDITAEIKKLQDLAKKYDAEQSSQTKESNAARSQEIYEKRQNLAKAEQAAGQELQKKYQEGIVPIFQKATKAVEDVAKAKGVVYVLDASAGKGLLVANGEDLYDALKTKLGLLADQKQEK